MLAVIIPAYNRPNDLRNALKSLTLQTKKMFMTYVIDDCSTEDLKSVCDEFKGQLHIYYFKMDKNGGPAAARQYGLNIAANSNIELVMFLDSDDMYCPNAVAKLSYEINHRGDDIVASPIMAESQKEPGFVIDSGYGAQTWLHGKIFRMKYLIDNDIQFNTNIRTNEDVNFLIKAFNLTKKKSAIEEPVYLWRENFQSITRSETGEYMQTVGTIDYICAVIDAINFLAEHGVVSDANVYYVIKFYKYYQAGLIKGVITEEIDESIYNFIHAPFVKENLKRYVLWKKVNDTPQFYVRNKKVYFYPQTFIEWFKQFDKEGEILSEICGN